MYIYILNNRYTHLYIFTLYVNTSNLNDILRFFLFLVFKHDLFVYLKTSFTGRSRRTRKPSSSSTLHINPRHLSLRSQVSVDGLSNLIRHTRPQRPRVEQSVPCLSVSADRAAPRAVTAAQNG